MPLTIVMYHYVRDLAKSRYPAIKGQAVEAFRGQLDYIGRAHEVVSAAEVAAAARGVAALPDNACWLTFDDGYADHFDNVFPLLADRGWQGSFFVPARPVLEGRLLDVHKIHFLLAATGDPDRLVEELRREVEAASERGTELRTWDDYVADYLGDCHLDTPQVLFVKLMLQMGLPEKVREPICDALFARFVTTDEAAFAAELYMSQDQIRAMAAAGMCIGSHGHGHHWLSTLSREAQAEDIDRSLAFLGGLGVSLDDWVMCYPYGDYDRNTLELVRARGGTLGVTTKSGVANLATDSPLELPRVDTIDLPVD
jgi:peptidoglycan/xylan/chitin deacetylase (PgdA/CDA1 family)